jgi:hypothetical protein
MNDETRTFVPWDGAFEEMYAACGYKIKEPLYGEPDSPNKEA